MKRTIFYLELALLVILFGFAVTDQHREVRSHEREEVGAFIQSTLDRSLSVVSHLGEYEHLKLETADRPLETLRNLPLPAIVELEGYTSATVSLGSTQLLQLGDKAGAGVTPGRLFPELTSMTPPAPAASPLKGPLPPARHKWFWHEGVLFLATAGPLSRPLPANRIGVGELGSGAMVLMFTRCFDAAGLAVLSQHFPLPSLRVARPGEGRSRDGVELRNPDGQTIARIAWDELPHAPSHFSEFVVLAAMIILALFCIGQYLTNRIKTLGKQIDHIHEVNRLDRARLRSLIEASNDGLIVLDSEGRVIDFNKAVTRRSGYTRDELNGKYFFELAPHLPLDDPDFLSGDKTIRSEARRKNGEIYWLEIGVSELDASLGGGGHFIAVTRDVTKRVEQEKATWHKAHYDALTDLPNRSLFMTRLNADLMQAIEKGNQCVLMFVDLDGFKLVNDTHGHETGDELLIAVADRFRETVTPNIQVARLGGDEFGIAMPAGTYLKQAEALAKKLTFVLSKPYDLSHGRIRISASIGIARGPLNGRNTSELMRAADKAMYQAKRDVPGTYHVSGVDEPNDGYRAVKRYS